MIRWWKRRRNRPKPPPSPLVPWFVIGAVAVLVVCALVVWLTGSGDTSATGTPTQTGGPAATPTSAPAASNSPGSSDGAPLTADQIANRPIPGASEQNPDPQAEVRATTPSLRLPNPKGGKVVAGVGTGFPHSPEGAVAQFAAMDIAAFHDFDTDAAREIYNEFSVPGSVSPDMWMPTRLVPQYFKDNSSQSQSEMTATYTPVQGLIKGVADGGDVVVVCLNGRLSYSNNGGPTTTAAQWDCARMGWSQTERHWMFARGTAPAPAPLTWPRDATSYKAGFRDLVNVPA